MAYDANDPADKKILQDAIDAALEEARETHETEVEGLKAKNSALLVKLNKARANNGETDTGEVERLENELNDVQAKLRTAESGLRQANRDLATRTQERDTATASLQTETQHSHSELINSRLTAALIEAKVRPEFLEDLSASIGGKATVKEVDGKRQAFVGDKPLGEFVKEWSLSDKGKHYVGAPTNGGGGSGGSGSPSGGEKKIYEMNDAERVAAYNANPADFNARVAAGENKKPVEKS